MKAVFLFVPILVATAGTVTAAMSDSGNAYVKHVIDGDTVVLGDGSRVRLIGIDAPEAVEPCGPRATAALRDLVEGRTVTLSAPDQVPDRDKYGRLLRYLDTDRDPAFSLLSAGLAGARYDSRDGYAQHPREARYRSIAGTTVPACPTLDPASEWYGDPTGYAERLEQQLLAQEQRKQRMRERAAKEKATREAKQRKREAEQRRSAERQLRELERQLRENQPTSPEPYEGYTGRRCYAPGGKTWRPC